MNRPSVRSFVRGAIVRRVVAWSFLGCVELSTGASASILPPGFSDEVFVGGFKAVTDFEFAPDGRLFVTEKQGTVWIVRDGVRLPSPFADLRDEVHNAGDKGLLGIALDPAFSSNGFVYLLYGVDPDFGAPDEPATAITLGRLTRYSAVGDFADLGSRTVLLGATSTSAFPQCAKIHGIGTLRFGSDGTLFVGCGDGAYADRVDFGQNIFAEDADCEGIFGAAQDLGAVRAQSLGTTAGKILRIDPATGRGLPSNPFWNGNPDAAQSKIWVLGLRNPFRFSVMPGSGAPGSLLISEVGWTTWEELNVARFGGENFGWPCREGMLPQSLYTLDPRSEATCGAMPGTRVDPVLTWNHGDPGTLGFTGFASTGAVYYDAAQFPVAYRDGAFFCDFGGEWIRFARLDSEGRVMSVSSFAFGVTQPVELRVDPFAGDLFYASLGPGKIHRIRYAAGNVPPVAVAEASPSAGPAPLSTNFSSSGTADANGDPMTFTWDFGDGSAPSFEPNPAHTYTTIGSFTASFMVRDVAGLADTAFIPVETLNMPPEVTLENPTNGHRFAVGEMVALVAAVNDREDGTTIDVHWEVQLIHNSHVHGEWFVWDGPAPPPFECQDHSSNSEDRYSYRVLVTATDAGGLATTREAFLLPNDLPSNGAPFADPRASTVTGFAPLPVYFDGTRSEDPDGDLLFPTWSFGDGLTATGMTPTHIYGSYGAFDARLTVTDVLLAQGTATIPILVTPGRGLECHWAFDEGGGGTASDASLHSHDASIIGAVFDSGALGAALRFDGVDDRVLLSTSLLSDRGAFTITAWIAPGEARGPSVLVGQEGAISFGFASAETLALATATGGEVKAPYFYRAGEWRHVAAVGDGLGAEIWINGEVAARGGFDTFTYGASAEPVLVASGNAFGGTAPYAGAIDEVRIHTLALDTNELRFLGTHPRINHAPYVEAGPDQELVADQKLRVEASITDDGTPEGATVTRAWLQTQGPVDVAVQEVGPATWEAELHVPGTYTFRIEASDGELVTGDDVRVRVRAYGQAIGLEGEATHPGLESIGPNPSRGDVAITFGVTRASSQTRITILDASGRALVRYPVTWLQRGRYRLDWNGRDAEGLRAAAGVYFVIADVGEARTSGKIVLLR